jgi:SAM-dependent methyltransferase
VDTDTGRLLQASTPPLADVLSKAYSDGTMITGLMGEEGIGRQYAEDCISTVIETVGSERLDGLRVLEIGSGTGYLLHRLHQLGAEVRGVEPGPQAELGAARYGIRIDRAFFPSVDLGDGYDLAILYLLLEHVADPEGLLREVSEVVRPGGTVLVVVQDEEPYVRSGELSLLFHEHYSYFSARTLERTILAAGGAGISMRRSSFSNLLVATYAAGRSTDGLGHNGIDLQLAFTFRERAERTVSRVAGKIGAVRASGGSVGIFVPSRAVNLLAMLGGPLDRIRFFDDDQSLRGTYYPGFPSPVEGRDHLLRQPPSCILVMSLSFGRKIAESIRPELPASIEVVTLASLLGS